MARPLVTESNTGLIGANVPEIQYAVDIAKGNGLPMFPVLTVTGGKSRKCVWAKAIEPITDQTNTCAISATGDATATLGTYGSPAGDMAVGDHAWFIQGSPA